ncbi:DUF349 domain-containing protein [Hymenobacter lutimineralis]|uniref:DUF349 domain-containing protein n=1 Tax=Hymenobacter lutimineralis TaxID=2606448 RepID=A0A5D6UX58_9BACT|nr:MULTISPECIES: DUF349 domain-containing protein [Hymenobacter]QIX59799.1 DUF349 domain-containing protein [Hymenobacter sp. BT18]TYZ08361.1 DUF349 domain-containing protein [Hymenobacter lutimineralis]
MVPENEHPVPNNAAGQPEAESPMSILERRLAEISAKQPAAAPPVTSEITEQPTQGTPPIAEPAAPGGGTAEPAAATLEQALPSPNASAEPAEAPSEPQRRAQEHTGTQNEEILADETTPEAQPEPLATVEAAPTELAAEVPAPGAEADGAGAAPEATAVESPISSVAEVSAQATPGVPEVAGEEEEDYVPETAAPDFATLDLPAQGAFLLSLLRRSDARQNRKQIFDLNRQYETALAAERAAARQQFIANGGEADDFAYAGPEGHAEVVKALQEFRESRTRDAKAEDEQRAKNLTHKQYLLSQLRSLVESAETKDSSARIKALQNDWKATGPVPQKEAQELWNSYHALLDIFYNNRGLFFEMKELDRRRNLEAKEALVTRAEALGQQASINKALQELRQLHEEWKHIGPVPQEQRDAVWNRFLAASEKVHDRKKEFLNARSAQENANLTRKAEILALIKPFAEFHTDRVNEWRSQTDALQKLKEAWDAAGLVPREKAEQINKQFWGAYKGFFQRKNQFFKALDEEKNANLKRKQELIDQAEAALQNPNWEEGREIVIRLQKDWKTIGRVPEKLSDKIWNRFRTACDAFFERKHEEVRQREHQAQQLSKEQAGRLEQIATTVDALTPDTPGTLEGFRELVSEWQASAGSGPRADAERAEGRFQALMGKYLDTLPGLSYAERSDLLFQLQVDRLKASADTQQLYKKEQALRRDINELENDISTLKTNLEFFARSKNAGQLRQEYQGRIDEAQQRIEGLKRQLKVIRS